MKKNLLFALSLLGFAACQQPAPAPQTAQKPAPVQPKPGPFDQPEWARNAVIYQVNTRQFSPEGNFAGVAKQLPRLRALGVDILWFMPVQPIGEKNRKGSLGSPYSVRDYMKVNPEFGTEADFKSLVQTAHGLGLKVILDWVPNHTSWDNVWATEHPDFYTLVKGQPTVPFNEKGELTDWTDVMDLNYDNREMRKAMTASLQHWVKNFDLDGYRMDVAGWVPSDYWTELHPALDSLKPVFMLAEWEAEPRHFYACFNANYGWSFKDVCKEIFAGKKNARALDSLKMKLDKQFVEGYYQMYFTQNHDENTWSGTEKQSYGASANAFNVLAFTWAGIPLIYNGQEDNLDQRLKFFERDPIHWKNNARTEFFQKLCALRHNNRALWSGKAGGELQKIGSNADDDIYAFTRERDGDRVLVVLNLSGRARNVALKTTSEMAGAYTNLFGNNSAQVTEDMAFSLRAWEYIVLTNK